MLGTVTAEFDRTCAALLAVVDRERLLDDKPFLQTSIRLRNPYVDPLHAIQIRLLRQFRAETRPRPARRDRAPPDAHHLGHRRRPAEHGVGVAGRGVDLRAAAWWVALGALAGARRRAGVRAASAAGS